MDWNPLAPAYIGLEFAAKNQSLAGPSLSVSNQTQAVAERIDSTVTETVTTLGAYMRGVAGGYRFLAEMLLAGQEEAANVTTTIFRPNASANVSGWTGPGTFVNGVNGAVLDLATYVTADNFLSSGDKHFDLEFPTAAALTGKRILAVRLKLVAAVRDAAAAVTNTMYLNITGNGVQIGPSGTAYGQPFLAGSYVYGTALESSISTGEIDRVTNQPWTVASVQAMDTASYRFRIGSTFGDNQSGTAQVQYFIYQVWLEIDSCDENRVATQVVAGVNTEPSWVTWTPRKVDGTANLAKVNGTDLTMVLRQPHYGNASVVPGSTLLFSVPYLLGFSDAPPVGLAVYAAAAVATTSAISDLGDEATDKTIGLYLDVSGTESVDAQPYARTYEVAVTGTVQQEISNASAVSYDAVFLPLRFTDVPGTLTITLKRRSDNVTMATATVTQADFEAAPLDPVLGEWRQVQASFGAPVVLAAATQYYFAFTAAGGTGSWYVQALLSTSASITGVGSYRGTTDVATYEGGDVTTADIVAGAVTPLVALTGLAVTPFEVPTGNTDGDFDMASIGGISVAWTPYVGGSFGYYELQRRDADTDWHPIAYIFDQAVNGFADYEARLGVASCYRIRFFTVVGIHSPWSADGGDGESGLCAVAPVGGCGYTFTSNEAPEFSVAYGDAYPSKAVRTYRFPEADDVVFEEFYLRDYPIGFSPLERSGSTFARRLLVSALVTPPRPGPRTFDPIRDLAVAAVSYICVRDEDGNRWFGQLQVGAADVEMPSQLYHVDIVVTEETDLPSTPDVVSSS